MLDLLVPDLLVPADAPAAMRDVRLPHLERWLVRSQLSRGDARSAADALAAAFSVEPPVPVAAIALAGEEIAPPAAASDGWLRADPVHLRVDRDTVTLHAPASLDIQAGEARALVAELAAHFGPELDFHMAAPERWYARVAAGELPVTTPLEQAFGRNVFGLLPRPRGALPWRSMLTESQMLLSASPVNEAREAAGRSPINSVWFWGEGVAPAHVARPYAQVHADDPFARGLGHLSGARVAGLPGSLAALDIPGTGESALAVLPGLTPALRRNDVDAWLGVARRLDEQWFAHLGAATERFDHVRLVLPSEKGSRIAILTPRAKLRWYRRAKPLAHHA